MKPIKIECPTCQQPIELTLPKGNLIWRISKVALLLIAGGALTVGGVYVWFSIKVRFCGGADTPSAAAAAKIPIDGALGWKLGSVLPVSKDEIHNAWSITLIPYFPEEKTFPMPQVLALPDRRIYEINMTADWDKGELVSEALTSKYGSGKFTWDEKNH